MRQNAIHILRSVTDTNGDSFIITTEDGKIIGINGGHKTETDYFEEYLKAVTGTGKPHIDAWFFVPHARRPLRGLSGGRVKVDIYFTAVGMITIPTEEEILAMMDEIRNNPNAFKLVA